MFGTAKLNYLQRYYSNLPIQGTKEWLNGRKHRFGGSEIGQLVSKNINPLIDTKINLKFNNNHINCMWGHCFERVAKIYLKEVKRIKIYEFGAIPSSLYPIAYSPDGLFINELNDELILLEIKCPIFRNVKPKSKLKDAYMWQIQSGMHILPCEKTSYIEFKFRKCSYDQIKDRKKQKSYDRLFHKCDYSKNPKGFLWFGYLYWKGSQLITEDFCCKKPDEIKCSFNSDVLELGRHKTLGTIMYFKCFAIEEQKISKNTPFFHSKQSEFWKGFEYLNNLISEQENEIKFEQHFNKPQTETESKINN